MASKLNVIYEYKKKNHANFIEINKLRVHFFFTEDQEMGDFWKFLNNTEVEIRLTDGPYWEDTLIGSTTGFPLQYFNE